MVNQYDMEVQQAQIAVHHWGMTEFTEDTIRDKVDSDGSQQKKTRYGLNIKFATFIKFDE